MPWQRYVADVALEVNPVTGRLAYREVRLTVPRQSGKALDCSTEILTENRHWVRMGEIQVGDRVFHPAGHSVEVTFVSDVEFGHDCYRMTTTDGRTVVADADHLWTVTDRESRRSDPRILTTQQLVEISVAAQRPSGRNAYRFALPAQEPFKTANAVLPIDPYILGAWLGDGWSRQAQLASHVDDVEHWVDAVRRAGFVPITYERAPTVTTVSITGAKGDGWRDRTMQSHLRRLGLIGDKHVPDSYLMGSPDQREALLQGLLDTDGHIDPVQGRVEFCGANQRLAEAVLFLARSLGWRATLKTARSKYRGKDCGVQYRVFFTPKRSDPFAPFRLPRKAARVRVETGNRGRGTVSIASIEPVPSVPVRCIKVDSPDGLYLAGRDLVATHNTSLIMAVGTHRALGFGQRQVIVYGAQTRNDARKKWEDDLCVALETSPLKRLFKVRKTNGNEAIIFNNQSRWGITSNTEKAGHGSTIDLGFLDEAFSQVDDRMEQAFKPAMVTRPQPQLWVVSTAGTPDSVYLKAKVDSGRSLVEQGQRTGVAYFEWSAVDDADPADPRTWRSCMPALGHTVTEDAIAADFASMKPIEFQRAYLNQWPDRNAVDPVIPELVWRSLVDTTQPVEDPVVFAVDANPERSAAAIAVAGRRPDGLGQVEIADAREGTAWAVPRIVELNERHKPAAWVLDPASAAGAWLPALQEAGIEPVLVTGREMAQACGAFYEAAVESRSLRHRDDSRLNTALSGARKRSLSDAWAWHRRDSSTDISPLVAVTLAWHGFTVCGTPKPPADPFAFFG